jgi:hypothetical protein
MLCQYMPNGNKENKHKILTTRHNRADLYLCPLQG